LVDSKYNRFEVLVEKINNKVYLTWGWLALKDFYGISIGAWIPMVYTGMGKFGILLSDRGWPDNRSTDISTTDCNAPTFRINYSIY
jgi:hypothetical protein